MAVVLNSPDFLHLSVVCVILKLYGHNVYLQSRNHVHRDQLVTVGFSPQQRQSHSRRVRTLPVHLPATAIIRHLNQSRMKTRKAPLIAWSQNNKDRKKREKPDDWLKTVTHDDPTFVGLEELADEAKHLSQDLAGWKLLILKKKDLYGAPSRSGKIQAVEEAAVELRHVEAWRHLKLQHHVKLIGVVDLRREYRDSTHGLGVQTMSVTGFRQAIVLKWSSVQEEYL